MGILRTGAFVQLSDLTTGEHPLQVKIV